MEWPKYSPVLQSKFALKNKCRYGGILEQVQGWISYMWKWRLGFQRILVRTSRWFILCKEFLAYAAQRVWFVEQVDFHNASYNYNWTEKPIWNPTNYSKIIFIDSFFYRRRADMASEMHRSGLIAALWKITPLTYLCNWKTIRVF